MKSKILAFVITTGFLLSCTSEFDEVQSSSNLHFLELDSVFSTNVHLNYEKFFLSSNWDLKVEVKVKEEPFDTLLLAKEIATYIENKFVEGHKIGTIEVHYFADKQSYIKGNPYYSKKLK